jgi:2-polyprenyl-3-methyl-5-hydroxy-6-metoxy-1,4-benzoquinol methylase
MDPATYDSWYNTPHGRWVGEMEYRLAEDCLTPRMKASLLDAGCGTGWFTRRAALAIS